MRHRLLPRSLRARLLLTYVGLLSLGLGGLILWLGLRLQNETAENAEHDLEVQAFLVASQLGDPVDRWQRGDQEQAAIIDQVVRSYTRGDSVRVVLLDPELRVLRSSDTGLLGRREAPSPELVAAREGSEQHDVRLDLFSGDGRLFAAAPLVGSGGVQRGVVQLSLPTAPIDQDIRQTWLTLLAAGGVVLLTMAVASLLVASELVRPIRKLTVLSEAMAAGNLRQQAQLDGTDEIARLAIAFNRMAERVREMLASQRAFTANAAHELRSPLTSIRLRLEMLQEHGREDAEITERYLGQMQRQVDQLRQLVDELLALSSVDEAAALPRAPLPLAPLVQEVVEERAPLAREASVTVRVAVPPDLPAVQANADQVHVVVRNLLDNAIKYTPAGGSVSVSARANHGDLCLIVADTGAGIPREDLPHIFERFYRGDKARTRRSGGTGLGLSLVQGIVQAHGGRIDVESEVGRGSTFTVHLPLRSGADQPAQAALS